ncbi:hypothetical protein Tco_0543024 [Tanacetum coccineum]
MEDPETKMEVETPYELLEEYEKKKLWKNNEANMTLYNALLCKTILTRTIRNFLRALPLKWRAKIMATEEAIDLATLPLDELIGKLNGGSDKDEDEVKEFSLMARNFQKFFYKGNRFGHGYRFGNGGNKFGRGRGNGFGNKVRAWSDREDDDEPQKDATCLMAIDSQEVHPKPFISNNDLNLHDWQKENEKLRKFNKDFTKSFEKLLKERRALESEQSKLLNKINDLEFLVKKLTKAKEVVKPC